MIRTKQTKEYKTPQFELIQQDTSNNVFFAGSGSGPAPSTVGGTLGKLTSTSGAW